MINMKEYTYKSRNINGEMVEGTIEAENKQSAANLLLSKKLTAVDIKEGSQKDLNIPFLNKVRTKDKVFFVRQLATMTKAGLPISQALNTLNNQSTSAPVRKMIEQMTRDIEAGDSLSTAFSKAKVFNHTDVSMITAGEASGKLDEVLEKMAQQSEKRYKTMKKIRGAFIYPSFLVVVVIAVLVLMLIYVLPQMEGLYQSFGAAKLPLPTRVLIGASNFLKHYYWLVLGVMVIVFFAFRMYVRTDSGRYLWHAVKLKIPLMGKFLQMSYVAIFTQTMSSLIASGVPILDALRIVSETMPNVIYRDAVIEVQDKVKQGKNLSSSLKENPLFPVMLAQMMGVGESTGEVDTMLQNLADYYSDEIDNWVKSFQSLMEPIIIVFMGVSVGGIMISVILPIYTLSSIIK